MSFRFFVSTLVFLFLGVSAYGQKTVTILSSEVNQKSEYFTGKSSNWPVFISLAKYDELKNSFSFSDEALKQLQKFKQVSNDVENANSEYADLIKKGALVFAKDIAEDFKKIRFNYNKAIREGSYAKAMLSGNNLIAKLEELKTETERNRVDQVSALLADKTGEVAKRAGLIGSWNEADIGAKFKKADGVKTEKESFAKLNFVDGSYLVVDPSTIAIVRSASIDKLTNATNTEVVIERGGLLASLAQKSKKTANFKVNAAGSETIVNSSKFWAQRGNNDRVTLSNYEGDAQVKANDVEITLQKNEGTVVVKGKDPILPVKLLPSPKLTWASSDSVTFYNEVQFNWSAIEGAVYYELDMASNQSFTTGMRTLKTNTNTVLVKNIEEGTSFIRLRGYDDLGLRGTDSPTYRLLRNKDVQPPALFFNNGNYQTYYSQSDTYTISGITEPNASLQFNETKVFAESNGQFEVTLNLNNEFNPIAIVATDKSNNNTKVSKQIVKMDLDKLSVKNWSVQKNGNSVTYADVIRIGGIAYESILVQLETSDRLYKAECDSRGNWAMQIRPNKTDKINISFINKLDNTILKKEEYLIK